MKKKCNLSQKALSLFLVLILCLSILATGCGAKHSGTTPADSSSENTDKENPTSENTSGDTDTSSTDKTTSGQTNSEVDVAVTPSLPLCEEKETLTLWMSYTNQYIDDVNDLLTIQELETRTNVHVDFITAGSTEASEKFGLMMASGNYPDILVGADSYYIGGLEKGVEDGILLDLTDLTKEYMPNYLELINSSPEASKTCRTDSGKIVSIYSLSADGTSIGGQMFWGGLLIRKDWLDDLGLQVPETIDEWHTVLTAFKEEKGAVAPLSIGSNGTMNFGAFTSAYHVMPDFYLDGDTVKFGPAEPGYKEFVKLFRDWYAEGLIDPDFTVNDARIITSNEAFGTGKTGTGASLWGYSADVLYRDYHLTEEEDFYLVGAKNPVLTKGEQSQSLFSGYRARGKSVSLTTSCQNPELACCWLDYLYSEEGWILNNFGIEGVTFERTTDGSGGTGMPEGVGTGFHRNAPAAGSQHDCRGKRCFQHYLHQYHDTRRRNDCEIYYGNRIYGWL